MSDETSGATTRVEGAESPAGSGAAGRVGFCQDCGTALTRETIKTVGSGVFCEPCLEKRLGTAPPAAGAGQAAGYGSSYVGSSAYVGSAMPPGSAGVSGEPSPALAGLLGMIPGVGAVYNGQYAKGLIHFVIFAILVMLNKDVSDVFGLFVLAWIIYQMVDAHHTARARRDGQLLPDPFGFNEMGDRMGFGRGWPGSATGPQPGTPQQGATRNAPNAAAASGAARPAGAAQGVGDVAAWGAPMTPGVPPAAGVPPVANVPPTNVPPPPYAAAPGQAAAYGVPPANWAGYVHPSAFANAPSVAPGYVPTPQETGQRMAAEIREQALRDAHAAASAYAAAYPGANNPYTAAPIMPPPPTSSRFPMGALWLIGLGVLVLVKTLTPEWGFSSEWIVAGVLAGMGVWIFMRRVSYMGGAMALHEGNAPRLVCSLRGPLMLVTLAVLFALQAASVATIGQSWPVLLIVFGVVVVMERTIGAAGGYVGPVGGTYIPPAGYPGGPAPVVPTAESVAGVDATKGGQG